MSECGFVPFPGNGAYGHWTCCRKRWHLGRHRSRNYTYPRIPRFWSLRRLYRCRMVDRRILAIQKRRQPAFKAQYKNQFGYRRVLYPTRYDPLP